ncbi:MAG: hypothetical protein U1E64_08465 [Sphingomonadaceae bacterium]|jgi:hypothetical protein
MTQNVIFLVELELAMHRAIRSSGSEARQFRQEVLPKWMALANLMQIWLYILSFLTKLKFESSEINVRKLRGSEALLTQM